MTLKITAPSFASFFPSPRRKKQAGNRSLESGLYKQRALSGHAGLASLHSRAGALDFRDFSGLLGEKENRIGIARTLPIFPLH
jgi:hypothetical protein